MSNKKYIDFLKQGGSLLIVKNGEIIFKSNKDNLRPLLECIEKFKDKMVGTIAFDKLLGNAAALLFVYAKVREVYALKGSKAGVNTLERNNINYLIEKIIPCVLNNQANGLCPMEELSRGKSPKDFYRLVSKNLP